VKYQQYPSNRTAQDRPFSFSFHRSLGCTRRKVWFRLDVTVQSTEHLCGKVIFTVIHRV
jgi:hypothetical protein